MMYEKRQGVTLYDDVDERDATGQALKDMDRAAQREEAAEGGSVVPWGAELAAARQALAEEQIYRRSDRRVIGYLGRVLEEARDRRAGELVFAGKSAGQAEADALVRRMDEAIARAKGVLS